MAPGSGRGSALPRAAQRSEGIRPVHRGREIELEPIQTGLRPRLDEGIHPSRVPGRERV